MARDSKVGQGLKRMKLGALLLCVFLFAVRLAVPGHAGDDPATVGVSVRRRDPKPTPKASEAPKRAAPGDAKGTVHTVVTVGCGGHGSLSRKGGASHTYAMAYQTFALEHSWHAAGMPGEFTRVVSGCRTDHDFGVFSLTPLPLPITLIRQLPPPGIPAIPAEYASNRLHAYFSFTPNNPAYAQGNKARILLEWWADVAVRGEYLIVVDPDMMFTSRFHPVDLGVKPRSPAAQVYQLVLDWRGWLGELCGEDCAYFASVSDHDAVYKYHAGPPFVYHRSDFEPLLRAWQPLVDVVYRKRRAIESDMLAYCIAAVKLRLPHILLEKSQWVPGPGFGPLSGGCQGLMYKNDRLPAEVTPPVLHYCSNYKAGDWFINKHWLRPSGGGGPLHNVVDCEMPLLQPPPTSAPGSRPADSPVEKDVYASGLAMVTGINAMLRDYKARNCPLGVRVCLEEGLTFSEHGSSHYVFAPGLDPSENNTHGQLVAVHVLTQPSAAKALVTTDLAERNRLREADWRWHCTSYAAGTACHVVADGTGPFLVDPGAGGGGVALAFCGGRVALAPGCTGGEPAVLGHAAPRAAPGMSRPLYSCKDRTHSVGAAKEELCEQASLLGFVG
ncbi:hypothetical protein DIPPA_18045 [Diplonema papillatum]|nr:hypothetical protein DIPPA_18045 [Diplonema papillatum]